jgi:uncharacterized protein YpuA (DUF1002 family)
MASITLPVICLPVCACTAVQQKRKNKVHNKVIKQSDDQKKNKEEIIRKFYLNLQIDLTDFEKEIPMDELLIGIKSQGIQDHKSKINDHLKELGNQLNDEKIVQVSETYSFGMDIKKELILQFLPI